jgi:hypothetical protein
MIDKVEQHCKVVWAYHGYSENVTEMYDKPRRLCKWWVKEHKYDSQYAQGYLYVTNLVFETKTS